MFFCRVILKVASYSGVQPTAAGYDVACTHTALVLIFVALFGDAPKQNLPFKPSVFRTAVCRIHR